MNKFHAVSDRARAVASNVKAKAAAVGTGLMVAAGSALATPPAFDSSSITTKITENAATATLIIGAFILAVWGLRSMGLLKGRG